MLHMNLFSNFLNNKDDEDETNKKVDTILKKRTLDVLDKAYLSEVLCNGINLDTGEFDTKESKLIFGKYSNCSEVEILNLDETRTLKLRQSTEGGIYIIGTDGSLENKIFSKDKHLERVDIKNASFIVTRDISDGKDWGTTIYLEEFNKDNMLKACRSIVKHVYH